MPEYSKLILAVHAQARRIDRDQALLGALGVGAFSYAHQIQSVHKMITAPVCRWLLADEVGLGKTIQAVMVMRALAAQCARPIRVCFVVPDDLIAQWEEELLARGHILATEEDGWAPTSPLSAILIRPSNFIKEKKKWPESIDLLLVDEFPKLTVQMRREISSAASGIHNVIIMTATPSLHEPDIRREILSILEPEAYRLAQAEQRDLLDVLSERERDAIKLYGNSISETAKRNEVERVYGVYRRLIRTQRIDYPDMLPTRIYQPVRLSATDGDFQRSKATRSYVSAARSQEMDIRGDLLLQVGGRSPASLKDRLSTLKRTSPALARACDEIDTCLRDELGDARLDALIDHVRSIHASRPEARIVVVAEDNPTTDYLSDMLELLADVTVANKRRGNAASESLEVHVASLNDELEEFAEGEAKVLVAADVAREGHNLQFAEEIIFYSLPWSPPAIQQWIGRIDRLGTRGLPSRRKVLITPIVVEDSIEARILDVLEETGVFHRSEVFDDSAWSDISSAISDAAHGLAGASWADAAKSAKKIGEGYDEWLSATMLHPTSRRKEAAELYESLKNQSYALPLLLDNGSPLSRNWYFVREVAAEKLLKIAKVDYLEVRSGGGRRQPFKSIWYKDRNPTVIFPELDPSSPKYHKIALTRRVQIDCPPNTYLEGNDNIRRALNFFDHGNPLHDSIIAVAEKMAPAGTFKAELHLDCPPDHPMLEWEGERIALTVGEINCASVLSIQMPNFLDDSSEKMSKLMRDVTIAAQSRAICEMEADRRWLVDICPPQLFVATARHSVADAELIDASASVLDPFTHSGMVRDAGRYTTKLTESEQRALKQVLVEDLQRQANDWLKLVLKSFREAVAERSLDIECEARLYQRALKAEHSATLRLDSKFEFNRAAQRAAEAALRLSEESLKIRKERLSGFLSQLGNLPFINKRMMVVVPRKAATSVQ